MLDYPIEECVGCGNFINAENGHTSCAECGEPICENCDHEERCKV